MNEMTPQACATRQATVARPIGLSGIGLHSGKRATVTVGPAGADAGIVIRRRSGGPVEDVRALWKNYRRGFRCTGLAGESGQPILTVEHLLASLSAFGIDNALIELDGSEIPIRDGSARDWCAELQAAGIEEQDAPRRYLRVIEPVLVEKYGASLRIDPADGFSLHVTTLQRPFAGLTWEGAPTATTFAREIAPSRSHGPLAGMFAKYYFAAKGLPRLRGAGPRTVALTIGRHYLGGMRLPDEPVRHRALDLIGDLSLAGYPLLGRVTAMQPSHALNASFVRTLMKRTGSWRVETVAV